MNKLYSVVVTLAALSACSTAAQDAWNTRTLDPPMHNLRGSDPHGKDDKPETDCDPEKHFSCDPADDSHCNPNQSPACDPATDTACVVSLEYKCVVHFNADYQRLLDENVSLKTQLTACQQGH